MNRAFFTLHRDLPREGPGDRESLGWAVSNVVLPRDARLLDAGCGPGADIAGLLEHAPAGSVVAIDRHAAYVEAARRRHAGDPRVTVIEGDMADPPGQFDLIWSAGAVYFLGVTEALRGWRRHLKKGAAVAVSQIAWRVDRPSGAALDFWRAYPAMCDAAGVEARVAAAGYRVVARRWLPDAAWAAYYDPLAARLAALRARADADAGLRAVLDAEATEIALWREHDGDYGYLQVVAVAG